ncbi:MAG TPA: dihydroorotase [Xanthomonadales bacterium]|nr:dihydroorotase [Xanthomonadales bacterium]
MNRPTIITNARIVSENGITEGDVRIRDGRIEKISGGGESTEGASVFDAEGRHLLPGMIDDQVHFREPGLTHKGSIATESRAALAGGITSFMEMPNTSPPTLTLDALEDKYTRAAEVAATNYAYYMGASNDNLEVIRSLPPGQACGVKIFMGASTGNMLVDNEETLAGIFREAQTVIATHCESTPRIELRLQQAIEKYGEDIPVTEHPWIRDAQSCLESSTIAVELAKTYDAQLHVLHLTTADEMALFEPGPIENKNITAEVCVHFLHFNSDDYPRMGNRIKCNPSIKSPRDQAALIEALQQGKIDVLATDHAPHTAEEKAQTNYLKAPAGLPLVQDAMLCILEHFHNGNFSLQDIVRLTSHNVARRFGVIDRGFIREGYWADLVLVDTTTPTLVRPENILYKCGWSPFEGHQFSSRIASTWVNGELAWDGSEVLDHNASMRLEFRAVRS